MPEAQAQLHVVKAKLGNAAQQQQGDMRFLLKGCPERFASMCLALRNLGVSTSSSEPPVPDKANAS